MFCWFLHEKRSEKGIPLVPDYMLSIDAIKQGSYYHKVLEPLFFELLNTNQSLRKEHFKEDEYVCVPYLNGGLFSPQTDDHYKYDETLKSGSYGVVTVPDEWFIRLYSVLSEDLPYIKGFTLYKTIYHIRKGFTLQIKEIVL